MRTPRRAETVPASEVSIPARIFRSVDLPAPLGPINPTRSPGAQVEGQIREQRSVAVAFRESLAPKSNETTFAIRLGGVAVAGAVDSATATGNGVPRAQHWSVNDVSTANHTASGFDCSGCRPRTSPPRECRPT